MAIRYDNQRIIPAPFVGISKEYSKTNHQKVGSTFNLTLQGKMVPCKGSPSSSGTFFDQGINLYPADETGVDALASFLTKEKALRQLFSTEGLRFEIEPIDGSTPMHCFPRVNSIDFPAGHWVTEVEYTINLECDEIFGLPGADPEDVSVSGDYFLDGNGAKLFLQEASEDWSLEFNDTPQDEVGPHSFRLTHNVNAVGKKAYDAGGLISQPWDQAKRWVAPRLGLDNTFLHSTSGLNLGVQYLGFNHSRTENTDELGGSYNVSETWVISSGNAFEDFTVNINTGVETPHTQVSIEGTVTGLDTRDSNFKISETKWEAANAKFNAINPTTIYTRAATYSGITNLNIAELSNTIGKNPVQGTINYNFSFDTRPSSCITGALSESIQIADTNATDVFASIPVLGRASGPILQDLSTTTATSRIVTVEVQVPVSGICPNTAANVAHLMNASPEGEVGEIIDAFRADLNANYAQVFKGQDNENWLPNEGRYSRVVGWTFQSCP